VSKERQIVFLGCPDASRSELCRKMASFGFQVQAYRDPQQAAGALLAAGLGRGLLVVDLPGLHRLGLEPATLPPGLGQIVPLALLGDPALPGTAELAQKLGACAILDGSAPLEDLLFELHEVFFDQRGQRRSPRRPVQMMVEVRHGGGAAWLQALNISQGGIYLRTLQPRPPGEQLQLRFTLPGLPRQLEVVGEVVYAIGLDHDAGKLSSSDGSPRPVLGHPGMGVRFGPLPPEAELALEQLLSS